MATFSWITGTSGLWTTAANWSSDAVPGIGDTALVDAPGNYLVDVSSTVVVGNVVLNGSGAEIGVGGSLSVAGSLTVTTGMVDISGGLGAVTINNGGIIDNSGSLDAGSLNNIGTFDNNGTLDIGLLNNAGSIDNTGALFLSGSVTSAQLGQVGGTGYLNITGSFDNTGGTLGENGQLLQNFGLIQGGTIGSGTLISGSTIEGVTVAGVLRDGVNALHPFDVSVTILDGLSGPSGGGPGTLISQGTLNFANAETVTNVNLTPDGFTGSDTIIAGSTLTINGSVLSVGTFSVLGPVSSTFDGAGTVIFNGSAQALSTDFTGNGSTGSGGALIAVQNADFENFGVLSADDSSAAPSPVNEFDQVPQDAELFINDGTFVNHAGGIIETGQSFGVGFITIAASTDFINDGRLSTWDPATSVGGTIDIAGFVQGNGTIEIGGGGSLILESATRNTQIIDFVGAGTLWLDQPALVPVVIEGFSTNDVMVLNGVSATPISYTSGDLKLQLASGTLDLGVVGGYSLADFVASSVGTGTEITLTASHTLTWIAGTSGVWTTASNWSPDIVPAVNDTAVVGVAGIYTVTAPGPISVFGLTVDNTAADVSTSGTFTARNFLSNAGTILNTGVLNAAGLDNLGTIDNSGTFVLTGGGTANNAVIENAGGTLINAGSVVLGGGLIQGGTLVNIDLAPGSTLDGVTVLGSLATTGNVTILGGLAGVVNFIGGSLAFSGDQSLAGITLAGAGSIVTDGTLTIGTDAKISQLVGYTPSPLADGVPLVFGGAGTIVNYGGIFANSSDSTTSFGDHFLISNGDASLFIASTDFENFGLIDTSDLSLPEHNSDLEYFTGTGFFDITAATFVNHAGGVIETGDDNGTAVIMVAGTTDFINDGTVTTNSHDAIPTDPGATPSNSEPGVVAEVGGVIDIAAAVTGSGTIVVDSGMVTVEGAVAGTQTIAFAGITGTLVVDEPASMHAVIVGFNPVGGIILNGVSANAISYTSGDLKLQTSTGTLDLGITGSHSLSDFHIVAGADVTAIDAALPCLAAGTRVATDRGDVPVEQLQVGDIVVTGDGQLQAIQWIGHRDTDCGRHADPRCVWPVRIAAHAFGNGLPRRAVLLSPDHAVFVDGVLVPIKHLVNGVTIVQRKVVRITYYHVELPRHDVLMAEGLPVESYLETGSRTAFENGGGAMQLHPHFAPDPVRSALIWDSEGYAPLVVAPAQLAPIKNRLERQAEALEVARMGRRRGSKAA